MNTGSLFIFGRMPALVKYLAGPAVCKTTPVCQESCDVSPEINACLRPRPRSEAPGTGTRIPSPHLNTVNHSVFERSMPSDLIREWIPVRVKKTRQNAESGAFGSASIRTDNALVQRQPTADDHRCNGMRNVIGAGRPSAPQGKAAISKPRFDEPKPFSLFGAF